MKINGTEARQMAKTQKTIMVPDELYRLFAMQEKRTGVTFARQAVAAFCSYFFSSRNGPDPVWLEAIVALETAELTIPELPAYVAQAKAHRARKIACHARHLLAKDRYTPFPPDDMDREAGTMETECLLWKREQERSDDPINAFFSAFVHYHTQVSWHLHPPAPDDDK